MMIPAYKLSVDDMTSNSQTNKEITQVHHNMPAKIVIYHTWRY